MARIYPSARNKILDAAERVILRDGLNGVSVDAVLRKAGISKGGFFHHFASKGALLAAVTERLAAAVGGQIALATKDDPRPHGRSLRAQIGAAFDMPAAERKRLRTLVLALISAAMESPPVAASARAANEEAIAQALADGVDAGTALVIQFALDGFFLAESLGTTKLGAARKAAFRSALLALVEPKREGRRHDP